ncbi:MAG: FAD-linked oxidase C-terminal domain-containing protein [bacterium]|nr:FAD-linked oxidase C-terminal domain-containing protein [bacterium]MDD5353780.1 FAD-linked oxidase C-terminal domain-containing protein [bacterium]
MTITKFAEVKDKLIAIVSQENVLAEKEAMADYTHDETMGLSSQPDMVVKAENTQQVSAILKLANQYLIPVVPRGAGTGLSGGAVPTAGGIVLSLEKMNKILEIDEENMMIVTEPGVITGALQAEVEKKGLFYPPDPASLDSCHIGGNLAECAGGARAVKYGVTKDYVVGFEAVLPSGEIIKLGGKLLKNVVGYDLISLIIGCEGTLAIITRIILKLVPLPKVKIDLLVPFDNYATASQTIVEIIKSKVVPAAIEFMDKESILACEECLGRQLPFRDAEAQILIELDGDDKEYLEKQAEMVGELCLNKGAQDVLVADTKANQEKLWEVRRKISESLKLTGGLKVSEDIVVPINQMPQVLSQLQELSKKLAVKIVCFGHLGDGNIHVNILKKELADEVWNKILPEAINGVFDITVAAGGTISGEHGIGVTKKKYVPRVLSTAEINIMKQIKKTFDPNNILNPGKIFE